MGDNHSLEIRPASFNDILFIQDVAYKTWPAAYGNILTDEQLHYMLNLIYSSEALTKQLQDNHHFFLALYGFEVIGFTAFNQPEPGIYKLQKLYVLPNVQKTGAGKALLDHAEQVVKSMGATRLRLNVNRNNKALSFYQKHGFSIIRSEDIDIGSGFFMNDYVMEKFL